MPAMDVTIYAQWTIIDYHVTYNLAGGQHVDDPQHTFTITNPLSLDAPVREGHQFLGWYVDEQYSQPFNEHDLVYEDLTLYARWQVKDYTLTFDSGEIVLIDPLTQAFDTPLPSLDPPVVEGFIFHGWYLDDTFTTLFEEVRMPADDLTLYARFEAKTYTLTHKVLASAGSSDVIYERSQTVAFGEVMQAPTLSKTNSVLSGWFTDSALNERYQEITMPANELVLYTTWIPLEYTYSTHDGEITLHTYTGNDTVVRIPEYIDGLPVRVLDTGLFDFVDHASIFVIHVADNVRLIRHASIVLDSLNELHFTANSQLETLEAYAIVMHSNHASSTFYLPPKLQTIDSGQAIHSHKIESFHVDESNPYFKSVDGIVYTQDGKTLVLYPSALKNTRFEVPDTVEVLREALFYNHYFLEEVIFSQTSNLRIIEERVFSSAQNLRKLTLPASLEVIEGQHNFFDTPKLIQLSLDEENVHFVLEQGILYDALKTRIIVASKALTGTLLVPDSVHRIDGFALSYSTITRMEFSDESVLTRLTLDSFSDMKYLQSVRLPSRLSELEVDAFSGTAALETIEVSSSNMHFSDIEGVLFNKNATKLILFPVQHAITYQVPDGVHTIGEAAFTDADVDAVTFSAQSNITIIERLAFQGSRLSTIHLPSSVIRIDYGAFANLENLTVTTDHASKPHLWHTEWITEETLEANSEVIWWD